MPGSFCLTRSGGDRSKRRESKLQAILLVSACSRRHCQRFDPYALALWIRPSNVTCSAVPCCPHCIWTTTEMQGKSSYCSVTTGSNLARVSFCRPFLYHLTAIEPPRWQGRNSRKESAPQPLATLLRLLNTSTLRLRAENFPFRMLPASCRGRGYLGLRRQCASDLRNCSTSSRGAS